MWQDLGIWLKRAVQIKASQNPRVVCVWVAIDLGHQHPHIGRGTGNQECIIAFKQKSVYVRI